MLHTQTITATYKPAGTGASHYILHDQRHNTRKRVEMDYEGNMVTYIANLLTKAGYKVHSYSSDPKRDKYSFHVDYNNQFKNMKEVI